MINEELVAPEAPKQQERAEKISTKVFDWIIFGSIFAVFFLTPLFFTGRVAQGIGFEKMILFYFLVLIGLVTWALKSLIEGEMTIKRTPLDAPLLAIVVFFGLSTLLSVSPIDSLMGSYGNPAKGFVAVLIFTLFYYLTVNNLTVARLKSIFWGIFVSGSLLVIFSVLQLSKIFVLASIFDFTKGNLNFSPMETISSLSMFIMMLLPIFVIASAQSERLLAGTVNKGLALAIKIFGIVMLVVSFFVLYKVSGFNNWPAAIVGSVIVLMFFLSKVIKISNENLIIPIAVFIGVIGLFVLGNVKNDLGLATEYSLARGASWELAKSSVKENVFFGSGPSTFYYDFAKFKSLQFNNTPLWNVPFDAASGIIFELLATVGVLGAIAVIVLFLISLSSIFITLIKNSNNQDDSILLALASVFAVTAMNALAFSLANSMILVSVIFSILAISASIVFYPEKISTLRLSLRTSAKYALALSFVFLAVSAGVAVLFTMGAKTFLADMYARQAVNAKESDDKLKFLNRAIELAPYQDQYHMSAANVYMGLANQEAMKKGDRTKIADYLGRSIEAGKIGVDKFPNKAANNEILAMIYENASFYTRDALEQAEMRYAKMIELGPNNPIPYLRIALVKMAKANTAKDEEEKKALIDEAIKKYDEAISKKEDMAAAYYGKSIAYEKLNDLDKAIDQLKNANILSRDNNDYLFELGRMLFNRGVANSSISQGGSKDIADADVADPSEKGKDKKDKTKNLTIKSGKAGGKVESNQDMKDAELIFVEMIKRNSQHANAKYSLALLYQKIGENAKAKELVESLLTTLNDQAQKEAVQKQFADVL